MRNVGFFKRIIVIVYDGLLLCGVTLVAYAVVFTLFALMPDVVESHIVSKTIKFLSLLTVGFVFYGWFWTHGGQTLGMKVWNLYLINRHGKFINWQQAIIRYFAAIISWGGIAVLLYWADIERWYLTIGIGFSWVLINKQHLAWHDILSSSRIVQVPKPSYQKQVVK